MLDGALEAPDKKYKGVSFCFPSIRNASLPTSGWNSFGCATAWRHSYYMAPATFGLPRLKRAP